MRHFILNLLKHHTFNHSFSQSYKLTSLNFKRKYQNEEVYLLIKNETNQRGKT